MSAEPNQPGAARASAARGFLARAPYPAFVLESDFQVAWGNAAARETFALDEPAIARLTRDLHRSSSLYELREKHFRAWASGEPPLPIVFRWESEPGAGDYLLLPFALADAPGAYAIVLMHSDVFEVARTQLLTPEDARTPKWYVPRAIEPESQLEAERVRDLNAKRLAFENISDLTTREWEIARRIAAGDRVSLLAEDLRISPNTVRNHLKAIFRKLGVSSQPQLVRTVRAFARARGARAE